MTNLAIDWLGKRAQLSPDNIALVDRVNNFGRELTYRDWNAQVNQTAHFFRDRLGLVKGDRVAILSTNCVEYLDVMFACNKLGTVLQNLNWRLAVQELEHLIKDAKPKIIIYSADFIDQIRRIKQRGDVSVDAWVAITEKAQPTDVAFLQRDEYRNTPLDMPLILDNHPWIICYTGGTTGLPKGAIHTYANVAANAVNTCTSWELSSQDCTVLNAPLFHTGGLHVFTTPLVYCGGTSIVCKAWNVDQVFDLVDEKRMTMFFGVPTMFLMMQEHPRWDTTDFSHLKFIISGGAPCPRTVFDKFWAKGADFKTGYGLTEAGPNTFWLPRSMVQLKPGAVGFPLMHVEVKLTDKSGLEITEPNIPGELLIRGPHRTPGYRNNEEATAEAIDDQGWLHTGDLAMRDAEGCYTIVGRKKEMYISGGENVYPAEVESIVHTHPAVREAAIFGVPHHKWGEVGRAIVSLRPGKEVNEGELLDWMRQNMAHYKVPKHVFFVDELPKTAAGKISKTSLRDAYGTLEEMD